MPRDLETIGEPLRTVGGMPLRHPEPANGHTKEAAYWATKFLDGSEWLVTRDDVPANARDVNWIQHIFFAAYHRGLRVVRRELSNGSWIVRAIGKGCKWDRAGKIPSRRKHWTTHKAKQKAPAWVKKASCYRGRHTLDA